LRARGEPHLSLALNRRLQELAGVSAPAAAMLRRTWGQLRATAEAAEAKRIAELQAFASREAEAWREVVTLIEEKKPTSYDRAIALLRRLRDLVPGPHGRVPGPSGGPAGALRQPTGIAPAFAAGQAALISVGHFARMP